MQSNLSYPGVFGCVFLPIFWPPDVEHLPNRQSRVADRFSDVRTLHLLDNGSGQEGKGILRECDHGVWSHCSMKV